MINFTKAQYVMWENEIQGIRFILDGETVDETNGTGGSVAPIDFANSHYAEIMRQVDDGELTIEPADE